MYSNLPSKIYWLLLPLVVFINSCKDPDDPNSNLGTPTTVAQDKQAIADVMNDLYQCSQSINSGSFATSFYSFFQLVQGTANAENWVQSMTDNMATLRNFDSISTLNRFDFGYFSGHYIWNPSGGQFSRSSLSNKIMVDFPSRQSSGSNDCRFTVTQYLDAPYVINNTTYYLPKNVSLTLEKGGTTIMSLTFSGLYNTSGFPAPQAINLNVFLAPFNYVTTVTQLSPTRFNFTTAIQDGSACETSIDATVSLSNSDYENLAIEEDLNSVQLNVRKGSMEIRGSWDALTYYSYTNPSVSQTNSTLNIGVFSAGQRIGDLAIYENFWGSDELHIYYKDGSDDNTSIYYDPLLADIESILAPYFGDL